MNNPILDKVTKWDSEEYTNVGNRFLLLNRIINHLHNRLFFDYEPSIGPGPDFFTRLNRWLENCENEEDQKLLFELVPNIFYIGREELNSLYREAYFTNYAKWIIDVAGINFDTPNVHTKLESWISQTWFCPLTDSFRINQFYHINNIPAKNDLRPDWRSLRHFGNVDTIKEYLTTNELSSVVLLEDFVGNGGQVSKAVEFAAKNFPEINFLIVPLLICPEGLKNATNFAKNHTNIQISPVISLDLSSFVQHEIANNSNPLYIKIAELAISSYNCVSNSTIVPDGSDPDPYGPFGWRKTGGMIVMHTNTPNNTLPLIHYNSETWEPLFKRHKRI